MILDLLYPPSCFSCGMLGSYLCLSCEKKCVLAKDTCIVCEKGSYLGLTHPSCKKKTEIDGVISIFTYEGVVGSLIKGIKYQLVTDAQKTLFQIVRNEHIESFFALSRLFPDTVLIPIPLSPKRQKSRGFNQSEYLAQVLSGLLGFTTKQPLIRKHITPQAQLQDKRKRKQNVSGTFELKNETEEKTVFLIDDVVTTGATAGEAARALKRAGVEKVFVLSYARG